MKSFLVHLASLAVMVHMTFGCNWHHGLGSTHACTNQSALSCCSSDANNSADREDHEDGHEHGDHDHDSELPRTTTFDGDESSDSHSHFCCQDDGCNVTKVVKFVFKPLDFSTPYLGGAEDLAVAQLAAYPGSVIDPLPDCKCFAQKVRSHLQFSIQLI